MCRKHKGEKVARDGRLQNHVPGVANSVHTSNLQFLWTIQGKQGFNSRHCTKARQDMARSLTL